MESDKTIMQYRQKPQRAGHVLWAVEPWGVVLFDPRRGLRCELTYPDAAIWDLLARGRTVESIRSLLEGIAAISPEEAGEIVSARLSAWEQDGWLETGAPE